MAARWLTCPHCQVLILIDDSKERQPTHCPECSGALGWQTCRHCQVLIMIDQTKLSRLRNCPECHGSLDAPVQPAEQWFYARDHQRIGPLPRAELDRLAAAGRLSPSDMVLPAGSKQWVAASTVAGLIAPTPQSAASEEWQYARGKQKSGPVSLEKLKELAASGGLLPDDMVLRVGELKWQAAKAHTEIFPNWQSSSAGQATTTSTETDWFGNVVMPPRAQEVAAAPSPWESGANAQTDWASLMARAAESPPATQPTPTVSAVPNVVHDPDPAPIASATPGTFDWAKQQAQPVEAPAPISPPSLPREAVVPTALPEKLPDPTDDWASAFLPKATSPIAPSAEVTAAAIPTAAAITPKPAPPATTTDDWASAFLPKTTSPIAKPIEATPPVPASPAITAPEPSPLAADDWASAIVPKAEMPVAEPTPPVPQEIAPALPSETTPVAASDLASALITVAPAVESVAPAPEVVAVASESQVEVVAAETPAVAIETPPPPVLQPEQIVVAEAMPFEGLSALAPVPEDTPSPQPEISIVEQIQEIVIPIQAEEPARAPTSLEETLEPLAPALAEAASERETAPHSVSVELPSVAAPSIPESQPEATSIQHAVDAKPSPATEAVEETQGAATTEIVRDATKQAAPAASPPAPSVPALPTISGYEILAEIGHDHLLHVYKARQTALNRMVALKLLRVEKASETARLRTEVAAAAQVQHPNLVRIFEVGDTEGRLFFAEEFVEGGSLAKKLAGQPQDPRQSAHLLKKLALGLHEAHQKGLIHRGLAPAQVMLSPPQIVVPPAAVKDTSETSPKTSPEIGDNSTAPPVHTLEELIPKLTGFGLARPSDFKSSDSSDLASLVRLAPEQVAGDGSEVGPATDVYGLGVILYEMLTGKPPFEAASSAAALEMVQTQEPIPLRRLRPEAPRPLETICLQCLRKEPHKRYASAAALADDLWRFLFGEPIQARRMPPWEKAYRWSRREKHWETTVAWVQKQPRTAAGIAGTVFLVIIVLWSMNSRAKQARVAVEIARHSLKIEERKKNEALAASELAVIDANEHEAARLKAELEVRKSEGVLRDTKAALDRLETRVAFQRALLAGLIDRLAETSDVELVSAILWANVIDPKEGAPPARLVESAEKLLARNPKHPAAFHALLGAANYRAGRFEAALASLNSALAEDADTPASTWLFLAMTHQRLGQVTEARARLNKARESIDKLPATPANHALRLELGLLWSEATELIQPSK